jgi:hypothetical protein
MPYSYPSLRIINNLISYDRVCPGFPAIDLMDKSLSAEWQTEARVKALSALEITFLLIMLDSHL